MNNLQIITEILNRIKRGLDSDEITAMQFDLSELRIILKALEYGTTEWWDSK